ncbi:MAG: LamG domain-containing protein [Nannocystaceae bacterium]
MGRWSLGLSVGLVAGWACGPGTFDCTQSSDCEGAGQAGQCVSGLCAFPDEGCDSGLRYGEHSGGLSGQCVEVEGSTTAGLDSSGPSTTSSATSTTGSTDDGPMLDESAGETGPGPIEFTDDELDGEFGEGVFDGTTWTDLRLAMEPGAGQGSFTSRIYDAGAVAVWDSLQWWPDAPYGKALPDRAQPERGYDAGAVDMRSNVLLMHMDGEALLADGDLVPDASGAGSDGLVISDGGPIALVPGVFGQALDDHIASRIAIPTALAPGLSFGEDDFTWSMWFRFDHDCASNNVFMGVDNADGSDTHPHLWLGCTDDPWSQCSELTGPRAAGVFRAVHDDTGDGAFFCSDETVRGDQWHHVLVVKQGHPEGEVWLALDGQVGPAVPGTFGGPMEYPDEPDFTIGAFSRGTYPSEGVLDEVAIWRRALTAAEAVDVYRRGVTALQVSVRVCSEPDCADEPDFEGPFVDPAGVLSPGAVLPLSTLPPGRYVQYRVQMWGASAVPVPALAAVTVRGHI